MTAHPDKSSSMDNISIVNDSVGVRRICYHSFCTQNWIDRQREGYSKYVRSKQAFLEPFSFCLFRVLRHNHFFVVEQIHANSFQYLCLKMFCIRAWDRSSTNLPFWTHIWDREHSYKHTHWTRTLIGGSLWESRLCLNTSKAITS